jgi:4-cresol dehydrogenase (hydroxylating)
MEVVLANGDILRTGMGAMENGQAWHVYKRGLGPSADGLFMQSNFGIVTKMGVWLSPQPERYSPCWVTTRKETDLAALADTLRPLMLDRVIQNHPMILNAVCAASALSSRKDWHTGEGALPDEAIERIASQPGLGRWVSRFAFYGRDKLVEEQIAQAREAFARIPGAELTVSNYDGANLPAKLENPNEQVQAGIPSIDFNQMTKWYGGEEGGHIGFSPAAPLTGAHVSKVRDIVQGGLAKYGLDYSAAIICQPRCFLHICLVVFDTKDEAQTKRAYDASKALVREAAKHGYGEYRAHLDFMDLALDQYGYNDHALRRFNERLKDALDPNGILSPGKQGIWPEAMRARRGT